jgi:glycosyltransferase involved in cell wall biosynthesis
MPSVSLSASIIIANYNYADFLGKAIDSALGQTHPSEVIVIDDGSLDASAAIIASYTDRVVPIIFPENRGQAAAFNTGIARTTGDVIFFLDSDDWITPNRAERVLQVFQKDPCIQVARHDMSLVDGQRGVVNQRMYGFRAESDPAADLINFGLLPGSTGCLAFRRTFLEELGPIPEDCYRRAPDAYLGLAGALSGTLVVTIVEPLYFRRGHVRQVTRQGRTDPSTATVVIRRRWCEAKDAAQLAQRFHNTTTIAMEDTWWQKKAIYEYYKATDHAASLWISSWFRHLTLLLGAQLPWPRKIAEVIRSIFLGLVPRQFFVKVWWRTHQGRPRHRLIDLLGRRQLSARSFNRNTNAFADLD